MNNTSYVNMRNKSQKVKNDFKQQIKSNFFIWVLVAFIAIAMMQTFSLGSMLSEAKAIGDDICNMRASQKILVEQYSFDNSNLSDYINNY